MDNYQLLMDTWEAEKNVDEALLKANDVVGLIIRLNDMRGGHHLDEKFTTQWQQAYDAGLLRVPYFVYNPWVNGQGNFDWLVKHMPFEAGAVMVDVEVRYAEYPKATYAAEVARFLALVDAKWHYMIYTGEAYLDLLSTWPEDADYWWSEYPYAFYPDEEEHRTWEQVRQQLAHFDGPLNANKVPGRWKIWQFTGDKLIMPGSPQAMDINVFPGTCDELIAWIDEKPIVPFEPYDDEHTQPYPGVDLYKVYRFHSDCHVAVIDPTGKRFLVTKYGLKRVSTVARELGAQIVINGGDYNAAAGHATGLHASQGYLYQPVLEYEPWLNLTANHKPHINPRNSPEKPYNALAGKRYFVQNGKVSPNTSPSWKEVHPRTLVGVTQDGKLIECVVDGRQGPNNIGVDLFDAARIMIEFGAWTAIDLDGGGSSTMWVNDRVVNSPIEGGVPGQERYVGTHIAMFVGTPPATTNYVVMFPVKPRLTPSMYEATTKPNLPEGYVFHSTVTREVKETIPPVDGIEYTITWVQLEEDGYWVPMFYKKEYVRNYNG